MNDVIVKYNLQFPGQIMTDRSEIVDILLSMPGRLGMLEQVAALELDDCWIAAGFVRNAVWDILHGKRSSTPLNDVDVVYYNTSDARKDTDGQMQDLLAEQLPEQNFSVKNQARMHIRNGHRPYRSTEDALRFWPETCTAIGARILAGNIDIIAPFGVDDLMNLYVRPTSNDPDMVRLARKRCHQRRWMEIWPKLQFVDPK